MMGEIDLPPAFGVRIDPFLGRPAMHTGLDFRGNIGDPVRATANGTVTSAGWSGGYGKMVEIDHGNGVVDPLRASVRDRREGRPADQDRPDHRHASARPGARPARTCTTRRGSTATRSIRRSSCAPASGWATRCKSDARAFNAVGRREGAEFSTSGPRLLRVQQRPRITAHHPPSRTMTGMILRRRTDGR